MESSYQYFKKLGCMELSFDSLPNGYHWITGCAGDGWYWNFFAHPDNYRIPCTDQMNKKVIMCKIKKL